VFEDPSGSLRDAISAISLGPHPGDPEWLADCVGNDRQADIKVGSAVTPNLRPGVDARRAPVGVVLWREVKFGVGYCGVRWGDGREGQAPAWSLRIA
jgi:hypothetical protein